MIVKVTRKRQVTIPKDVSDELGISEGDLLLVRVEEGKIILEKVGGLTELAGALNPGKKVSKLAEELDRERKKGGR